MTAPTKSPVGEMRWVHACSRVVRCAAVLFSLQLLAACQDDATQCAQGNDATACARACNAGELGDRGCAKLGELYAEGRGVWNSTPIAAMFHERACKGGERSSCERLASLTSAQSARAKERAVVPQEKAPAPQDEKPISVACVAPGVELPSAIELPEALKSIETRCEAGDGGSCATLAARLQQGIGVALDPARAARLYERGCNQHDVPSCRKMGQALEYGMGTHLNTVLASQFYQRACMAGQMAGCTSLGELALLGAAGAPSAMAGIGNLQRSCDRAYAPACLSLAATVRQGVFGPPNPQLADRLAARASELFSDGCDRGVTDSCLSFGESKEFPAPELGKPGSGPRATTEAALKAAEAAYRKACDAGLGRGCVSLARFLMEGERAEEATVTEAKLAQGCADDDVLFCQAWLSLPPRNPPLPTLQRACASNFGEACSWLAELAQKDGSIGDPTELLSKACQLGSSRACTKLMESGRLTGEAAITLRRDACRKGNGEQCAMLAKLHLDGPFEPKDPACARALFEQSCAEGARPRSIEGCERAAQMARDGQGGSRDDALANRFALAAVSAQAPEARPPAAAAPAASTAQPSSPPLTAPIPLPPLPVSPAEPPLTACSTSSQAPARTAGSPLLTLAAAGAFVAMALRARRER